MSYSSVPEPRVVPITEAPELIPMAAATTGRCFVCSRPVRPHADAFVGDRLVCNNQCRDTVLALQADRTPQENGL